MVTQIELLQGLEVNPKWVERAIVVLYERQTADEQRTSSTKVHNGRGFASCDARAGTYMAQWILSDNRLSGIWLERARKMAKKYIRQLMEEVELKERERMGYKTHLIVKMAQELNIPLEKFTVGDCKPEDVCGLPTK
jgi:hypothetical protein